MPLTLTWICPGLHSETLHNTHCFPLWRVAIPSYRSLATTSEGLREARSYPEKTLLSQRQLQESKVHARPMTAIQAGSSAVTGSFRDQVVPRLIWIPSNCLRSLTNTAHRAWRDDPVSEILAMQAWTEFAPPEP